MKNHKLNMNNIGENNGLNNESISINEIMFIIFYSTMLLVKGFGLYEGQWPFDVALVIAFVFFLLHLFMTRYSTKSFVVSMLLLSIGIITGIHSNEYGAMLNIMVIVGMNGVSSKKIVHLAAYLWSLVFVLQCFLTCSGIRTNQIFRIHRKFGTYVVRWSMGFTHPNVFHISYFVLICLLYLCINPNRGKIIKFALITMLGNVLVFLYSFSITGLLIVTFFLIICIVMKYNCDLSNQIARIFVIAFPSCCALFSVIGPIVITGKAFKVINDLLSTRFALSRYFLTTQKIGLWGTSSFNTPDTSYTIDSSYVYALMHYGIIYFMLFIGLITMCIYYLLKRRYYDEICVFIGCCLAGVTEPFLNNTSFKGIIFIFIGEMVYSYLNTKNDVNSERYVRWLTSCFIIMKIGDFRVRDYFDVVQKKAIEAIMYLRKNNKKILLVVLSCGLIGCIFYGSTVIRPQRICASPWDCDIKEGAEATKYVFYDTVKNDENVWVLSNRDLSGKLYFFDGFTVSFEYGRRMAGVGFCWAIVSVCVQLVFRKRTGDKVECC